MDNKRVSFTRLSEEGVIDTEYIELKPQMVEWLAEISEESGVTLQELVTFILLRYREEYQSVEYDETSDDVEIEEIDGGSQN